MLTNTQKKLIASIIAALAALFGIGLTVSGCATGTVPVSGDLSGNIHFGDESEDEENENDR